MAFSTYFALPSATSRSVIYANPLPALTSPQGMVPCSAISARAASVASMSARSSAAWVRRSRSSASITAATRRPRRVRGQEDGLVSGAGVVDDLIETATRNRDRQVGHDSSMGEGRSFHTLSPRSDSGSASPLSSLR